MPETRTTSTTTTILQHAACLLIAAAFTAWVFANPRFIAGAFNADSLLAVGFWWDVLHRAGSLRQHELARIPSLLPDMAAFGALYAASGSLAWGYLLYAFLQLMLFVYAAGLLIARLAPATLAAGAAMAVVPLAGLGVLALIESDWNELGRLLPLTHAGPFALAILGLAAAIPLLHRRSPRCSTVLAAAASLAFLADQLLLATFAGPVILAAGLMWRMRRIDRRAATRIVLAVAAGLAFGAAALRLLKLAGMRVGSPPAIKLNLFPTAIRGFFAHLPGYAAHFPGQTSALLLLFAACLALALRRRTVPVPASTLFVWIVALASAAAMVGFTAAFFEDEGSFRYLDTISVWPIVLLAPALLARLPSRHGRTAALAALVAAVAALLLHRPLHRPVALLAAFDTPYAECLRRLQPQLGLHAALAGYWRARPAMVAMGWSLQIDTIRTVGTPLPWANDRSWFRSSLADPAQPPRYDAILMADLDPDAIARRFGPPTSIHDCPDGPIWHYADGAAVQRRLGVEQFR